MLPQLAFFIYHSSCTSHLKPQSIKNSEQSIKNIGRSIEEFRRDADNEFERANNRFERMDNRFDRIENKIDGLEERMRRNEMKVCGISAVAALAVSGAARYFIG